MSNNDEQEMISLTDILNELFEQKNILLTEKYVGKEVFVQYRKEAFSKLKKRFSKTVSLLRKTGKEKEKQLANSLASLSDFDLSDIYNSMVDDFEKIHLFKSEKKKRFELEEKQRLKIINEIIKVKMQELNENISITNTFSKSFDQNNKSHYFDKLTSKEMVKFMLLKEDVIVEMNPEYKAPFSKFINLKFSEMSSLEWIYLINAFQQQLSNSTGQVQEKEEAFNHFINSFKLASYMVLADINLKFSLKSFTEVTAIVPSAITLIEEFENKIDSTMLSFIIESYLQSCFNIQDTYILSAVKFQEDDVLPFEPFLNHLNDADLLLHPNPKVHADKMILVTALNQFFRNYQFTESSETLAYYLDNELSDEIIDYALKLLKNKKLDNSVKKSDY